MGFLDNIKQKIFPEGIEDVDTDYGYEEDENYVDDRANVSPVRQAESYRSEGAGVTARSAALEMKVVTPTKYEAVTQIADLLLDKKTVLLNLENTNRETAKRLIDFLSGVAYALGGDIQKVADNTFAVTPNNVAVSNEAIESEFAAGEAEEQYE